ncbi:unnamed protein product, partial [Iphiclides podalirius]
MYDVIFRSKTFPENFDSDFRVIVRRGVAALSYSKRQADYSSRFRHSGETSKVMSFLFAGDWPIPRGELSAIALDACRSGGRAAVILIYAPRTRPMRQRN